MSVYDVDGIILIDKGFVTPEMYGAAGDGVTDDTAAWQAAVNSGFNVLATQPTYRCGQINITSDIEIDFNNANFIATENRLFYCQGEVVATLTGEADYTANQVNYAITDADYATYSGYAMLKGTNNFEKSRSYYLGGFACEFWNGTMMGSYPIDVTTVSIEIVNPIKVIMSNCGYIRHSVTGTNRSIEVLYGMGCVIKDCIMKETNAYNVILFNCCLNCIVDNCKITQTYSSSNNNSYLVTIANSSFCIVQNCYMFNEKWHCWTTGDTYLCYGNKIENCTMLGENTHAISDHENALGTIVKNTIASNINLSGRCEVDTVTIKSLKVQYMNCLLGLGAVSEQENAVYNIRNVIFDADPTAPSSSYIGIWLRCSPQTAGNTYYFTSVNFKNIKQHNGRAGDIIFSQAADSNYVFKDIVIDDVNLNLGIGIAPEETNKDITNYTLTLRNIIDKTSAGAYVNLGRSTTVFNDVNIYNCKLNYIGNGMSNFYFSDLYLAQTMSSLNVTGSLCGTGLHSRFTAELLLRPTMLNITDMLYGNQNAWLNISKGNDNKCYYQRWVGGVLTTYEITA